MQTPTQPTPSPFGRSWSQEIGLRCEARQLPADVAAIAAVLGALLDNGLVDLATAGAICRGECDPAELDGYLIALAADVALAAGGAQ